MNSAENVHWTEVVMRPQELTDIVHRQPFQPFRVTLTDGRTYDIKHPDEIMVLRGAAVLATKADDDVLDLGTIVSLLHVMQIQYIDMKKPNASKNGNGKKKGK
jgi:hypothetical protein